MRTTPRRLITLHFGQRRFTDADTFMIAYSIAGYLRGRQDASSSYAG